MRLFISTCPHPWGPTSLRGLRVTTALTALAHRAYGGAEGASRVRFIRTILGAVIAAALGVVLGRLVAGLRREAQGEEAIAFDASTLVPQPQDVVPGLVAALRVSDAPWSALHVPPWLAAFAVNFALTALGSELAPWLRTFGIGGDEEAEPEPSRGHGDLWTVEATRESDAASPSSPPSGAPYPGFRPFSG
jgi:hypothetical protein